MLLKKQYKLQGTKSLWFKLVKGVKCKDTCKYYNDQNNCSKFRSWCMGVLRKTGQLFMKHRYIPHVIENKEDILQT